jgi:hypothetical protein
VPRATVSISGLGATAVRMESGAVVDIREPTFVDRVGMATEAVI